MRSMLIEFTCASLWLAAAPAYAQAPGDTPVKHQDKPSEAGSHATPHPVTPQTSSTGAAELSSDAMMKEQQRRDREEQAERDRDDR